MNNEQLLEDTQYQLHVLYYSLFIINCCCLYIFLYHP